MTEHFQKSEIKRSAVRSDQIEKRSVQQSAAKTQHGSAICTCVVDKVFRRMNGEQMFAAPTPHQALLIFHSSLQPSHRRKQPRMPCQTSI